MGARRVPAGRLRPGDLLVRRPAGRGPVNDLVTGTSRAVPTSPGRVCVFLESSDLEGRPVRTRRYFDVDELVEVPR